jgi:hypothetical protein
MDWSCGGFGTLINKGDSGGIGCGDFVLHVEEKKRVSAGDVVALFVVLRGSREARGSKEAIVVAVLCPPRHGQAGLAT